MLLLHWPPPVRVALKQPTSLPSAFGDFQRTIVDYPCPPSLAAECTRKEQAGQLGRPRPTRRAVPVAANGAASPAGRAPSKASAGSGATEARASLHTANPPYILNYMVQYIPAGFDASFGA